MTPRGGSREGAGRKAKDPDEKAKPTLMKIPPDLLTAIDAAADEASLNRTQWAIKVFREALGSKAPEA